MAGRCQVVRRRRARLATVGLLAVAIVVAVFADHDAAQELSRKAAPARDHTSDSARLTTLQSLDPSQFSPGACVAYPPTSGDRHLTVFLDAGHGGIDPGAVGTTQSGHAVHEADETLPVVMDTNAILRRDGFRVVVSRTGPTTVVRLSPADVSEGALSIQGAHHDVAARAVCANLAHADALIGIYFDAGTSPSNAGSVTGYDAVRPFAADNLRLATLVQADVLGAMNARGWQIPNDGVVEDEYLGSAVTAQAESYGHLLLLGPAEAGYFTTPSLMPGALIEPLFITDPFEASIAANGTGQQVIARGLAEAVVQYFAPPASSPRSTSSPGSTSFSTTSG